jgi:hypothetical protein
MDYAERRVRGGARDARVRSLREWNEDVWDARRQLRASIVVDATSAATTDALPPGTMDAGSVRDSGSRAPSRESEPEVPVCAG